MVKKISIRLPDDHPLFQYPAGERSRLARDWMETGMNIKEIISRIESKLDSLLEAGIACLEPQGEPQEIPAITKEKEEKERVIAKALASALDFF